DPHAQRLRGRRREQRPRRAPALRVVRRTIRAVDLRRGDEPDDRRRAGPKGRRALARDLDPPDLRLPRPGRAPDGRARPAVPAALQAVHELRAARPGARAPELAADVIFGWLRERRRLALRATPFPDGWRAHLDANVGCWPQLSVPEQARLSDLLRVFVAE